MYIIHILVIIIILLSPTSLVLAHFLAALFLFFVHFKNVFSFFYANGDPVLGPRNI